MEPQVLAGRRREMTVPVGGTTTSTSPKPGYHPKDECSVNGRGQHHGPEAGRGRATVHGTLPTVGWVIDGNLVRLAGTTTRPALPALRAFLRA